MTPEPPVTSENLSQVSLGKKNAMLAGCCIAIGSLIPVAMYQTGMTNHLLDPPLDLFDSDMITGSKEAHPFGIPDALLGLVSFGATLALVATSHRFVSARRLLATKLLGDSAVAAMNATRQVKSFGKICS